VPSNSTAGGKKSASDGAWNPLLLPWSSAASGTIVARLDRAVS